MYGSIFLSVGASCTGAGADGSAATTRPTIAAIMCYDVLRLG